MLHAFVYAATMPGGRPCGPRGPTYIVDAADIKDDRAVLLEQWNLARLGGQFAEDSSCLKWLAARSLIANSVQCPTCGQPASLTLNRSCADSYGWKCRDCRFKKAVRAGSFFEHSHLPLNAIVVMMYCWAVNMPQTFVSREAGIPESGHTVIDWCNFFRDEAAKYVDNRLQQIGGLDNNNQPLVVEIDTTKYFHRKYHRGTWRSGHWVFGAIERGSGKCVLVEVTNREAQTLEREIQQHILPGTHIVSDGWAGYNNIQQIAGGIYMHDVIIHQHNFDNPDIHIQNVKNMWMRAKRTFRRQCWSSRALFPTYLKEFAFRYSVGQNGVFSNLILGIAESYQL